MASEFNITVNGNDVTVTVTPDASYMSATLYIQVMNNSTGKFKSPPPELTQDTSGNLTTDPPLNLPNGTYTIIVTCGGETYISVVTVPA
jgi:hypothetical protein